jgi:hypothetical protein
MDDSDAWLADWRRLTEGLAAHNLGAGVATGLPGLREASAAFARFAEDYGRLGRPAAGAATPDVARFNADLRALAERLIGTAVPAFPRAAGAGPEWLTALEAWSTVLAGIASDTAARFAAQLASSAPPPTLRAAFDCWIDCAEAAFQHAAHSDAFVTAQARLINAFVAERARQQTLVEQAARALGLPTRAEVDGLHDAVRALRQQPPPATRPVAARRASAPGARVAPRVRRQARTKRP